MLRMTRVAVPSWTRQLQVDTDEDEGDVAYQAFQPLFVRVLDLIHRSVEEYVNNDDLVEEEDDGVHMHFPYRAPMTGEYYLGDQHYYVQDIDRVRYYCASIMARCTEKPWPNQHHPQDYLGLDIMITLDPLTKELAVWSVDSSVI